MSIELPVDQDRTLSYGSVSLIGKRDPYGAKVEERGLVLVILSQLATAERSWAYAECRAEAVSVISTGCDSVLKDLVLG